jgi:hypothetical protein
MKRTLIAVGVAVLASLMWVPFQGTDEITRVSESGVPHVRIVRAWKEHGPFWSGGLTGRAYSGRVRRREVLLGEAVVQTLFFMAAGWLAALGLQHWEKRERSKAEEKQTEMKREVNGSATPPIQTRLHWWQDLPPGWVYFLLVAVLIALLISMRLILG